MQPFTTTGVIRESWELFKKHWGVLWGALIIAGVIQIVLTVPEEQKNPFIIFVVSLVGFVVARLLQLGQMRISLNIVDAKPAHVIQLFGEHRLLLRFIGASVLYGLIVLAGIILLVVPAFVWGIKYGYFMYALLDKNVGVVESLKMSAALTDGAKLDLFWFMLVLVALVVVSALPLGLGLIATIPMAILSSTLLYRRLLVRREAVSSTPAPVVPPPPAPVAQS